jgi:trehalose 6-phosphate phosphatase
VTPAATLSEQLAPLRAEPREAAILLDIDGTLAPIVRHAEDAIVPEATRMLLIKVARTYGLVACISGRTASDARRMVSIGSMAYVGNHGAELLRPGTVSAEVDPEFAHWAKRVQQFTRAAAEQLRPLRVRAEDKGPIVALHWRGAPDQEEAEAAVREVARRAEGRGLRTHWGRKVLEIRPGMELSKANGLAKLLRDASPDISSALYAGDDVTDLDAFRALTEQVESGRLRVAVRVGIASDEGPPEIQQEADVVLEGQDGVRELLHALLAPD